jgi:uncharacterized protein YkwD
VAAAVDGDSGERMRKPQLVVVVGVAAVLLGGGIAATAAGAGTAPPVPSLPGLTLPEVPDLPAPAQAEAPAGPDAVGNVPGAPDPGAVAGGRPGATDPGAVPDAGPGPADPGAVVARPGPGRADPGAVLQRPAGGAEPQPHGPRPAADRPDADPAPQRPAGTLAADAHRQVDTDANLSTSPSTPVQQEVLALINANRRRFGCGELTLDRRLIAAAAAHAADMARRGYFAHESPNGENPGDRVTGAGYDWSHYGENIARGADSPYEVVDGWMHSPEHRRNILDCEFGQMGVGLAFAGDRTPYWVQDFATPQH